MTLSITVFRIMTLSILALSIMTLSITIADLEWGIFIAMLSVVMLNVVMLSVVAPAKIFNTHKILNFSKLRFLVKIFFWQIKHFFQVLYLIQHSNKQSKNIFLSDFKCFCVARGKCFKTLLSHLLNKMSHFPDYSSSTLTEHQCYVTRVLG